jgi:hypothetical protein
MATETAMNEQEIKQRLDQTKHDMFIARRESQLLRLSTCPQKCLTGSGEAPPPAPPHGDGEGRRNACSPSLPQWGGGWGWGILGTYETLVGMGTKPSPVAHLTPVSSTQPMVCAQPTMGL